MLSAILLPIKPSVFSAVFWIALFEAVLKASLAYCLAWSRSFWLSMPFSYQGFSDSLTIFLAKDKTP